MHHRYHNRPLMEQLVMKHFTKSYTKVLVLLMLVATNCKNYSEPYTNAQMTPSPEYFLQTNTPFIATSTVTFVPTSTLQPVLNTENAEEMIFRLLKDNANCQLPCWWGITPAETTSQDAISILNAFSAISSRNSLRKDHGSMRLQVPNGTGVLSTFIEYDSPNDTIDSMVIGIAQLAENQNGEYVEVYNSLAFAQATKSLLLPDILKSYGLPEEILVSTYSLQPLGSPVFFDIQLFYPNYGFLSVYHSLMEFSRDGYLKGCPEDGNINLAVWTPKKFPTIDDVPISIRNNISQFPLSSYLDIGKATNMSIQDFYNAFIVDEKLCLETPSDIWPFPGN